MVPDKDKDKDAAATAVRTLQLTYLEHAVQTAVSLKTADLCRHAVERLCRSVVALRSEFEDDVVRQIEDLLLMTQPPQVAMGRSSERGSLVSGKSNSFWGWKAFLCRAKGDSKT